MKNTQDEFYPVALTIAGSDSGGGAGIQADLRSFNAAGVFGCSVITAVTAQNPRAVAAFEAVSPELVAAQFNSVTSALAVKAVKTGMLANAAVVKTVIDCLKKKPLPLVVDPVMISTSGARLLDDEGMQLMKNELLPLADLVTPNIPEAEWLLQRKLFSEDDYIDAALAIADLCKGNCLLKTGHAAASGNQISDIAVIGKKVWLLSSPRVGDLGEYASHGTGCTLSSAITAMLAVGNNLKDALRTAKAYVYGSLCETAVIGKDIEAMYPPLEDYSRAVSLRSLKPDAGAKGSQNVR